MIEGMQTSDEWCGKMRKWLIKKTRIMLCVISSIFFILLIWTVWGNTALMVSTISISSSHIPAAFSGFRIAQVSDLHNAEFGRNNAELLSLLSESRPDIIVITGDLIDANHTDVGIALGFVQESVRIAPTYYVTGNHEAASPQYDTLKAGLEAAGVIVLEDETVYIERVSHRPELFETYVDGGIDLVFSGHAHGGQFRLPFIGGLVAPNQGLFPKYDAGLYTDGSTSMVVSRGIGNSIIPFRFNNRPEIVLVELNAR